MPPPRPLPVPPGPSRRTSSRSASEEAFVHRERGTMGRRTPASRSQLYENSRQRRVGTSKRERHTHKERESPSGTPDASTSQGEPGRGGRHLVRSRVVHQAEALQPLQVPVQVHQPEAPVRPGGGGSPPPDPRPLQVAARRSCAVRAATSSKGPVAGYGIETQDSGEPGRGNTA